MQNAIAEIANQVENQDAELVPVPGLQWLAEAGGPVVNAAPGQTQGEIEVFGSNFTWLDLVECSSITAREKDKFFQFSSAKTKKVTWSRGKCLARFGTFESEFVVAKGVASTIKKAIKDAKNWDFFPEQIANTTWRKVGLKKWEGHDKEGQHLHTVEVTAAYPNKWFWITWSPSSAIAENGYAETRQEAMQAAMNSISIHA